MTSAHRSCGYSAALWSRMPGEDRVTSIDIGPYLTQAAGRLSGIGLSPKIITCDATGPPPGIHHPSRHHLPAR